MNWMIFYDLMWYNYPSDKEYFKIHHDLLENIKYKPILEKKLSSKTENLERIINKYHFLYNKIPFIEHIYVCNSLSFSSVHKDSDIDFFVICKENRIFLWKFFLRLFFKIFWMYWSHQAWKFCTWFFITNNNKDLYPISIYPLDIYLAYRIAHLQNLYSENLKFKDEIYKENMRVSKIIPNYQMQEKEILKIKKTTWSSWFKKFLEFVFWWNILNNFLWFFRKKKMKRGKKKLGVDGKNIIISDNILKFQAPDIRKIVYLKYKTLKQKSFHKIKTEKELF